MHMSFRSILLKRNFAFKTVTSQILKLFSALLLLKCTFLQQVISDNGNWISLTKLIRRCRKSANQIHVKVGQWQLKEKFSVLHAKLTPKAIGKVLSEKL